MSTNIASKKIRYISIKYVPAKIVKYKTVRIIPHPVTYKNERTTWDLKTKKLILGNKY